MGGDKHEAQPNADAVNDWLPGDWMCVECQTHNFARRDACLRCGTMQPGGSFEWLVEELQRRPCRKGGMGLVDVRVRTHRVTVGRAKKRTMFRCAILAECVFKEKSKLEPAQPCLLGTADAYSEEGARIVATAAARQMLQDIYEGRAQLRHVSGKRAQRQRKRQRKELAKARRRERRIAEGTWGAAGKARKEEIKQERRGRLAAAQRRGDLLCGNCNARGLGRCRQKCGWRKKKAAQRARKAARAAQANATAGTCPTPAACTGVPL